MSAETLLELLPCVVRGLVYGTVFSVVSRMLIRYHARQLAQEMKRDE